MTTDISKAAQANYQQLAQLKPDFQALVAATMVERMLPNYQLFSQLCEFGDGQVLRVSLNLVWEKLQVKQLKLSIQKQLEKIEPQIPDVEQFEQFGVYPAFDTVMALTCLLQGMAGDEQGFVDACKLSQSSVSKVIELELGTEDAQLVHRHELMQYEVEFLAELIDIAQSLQQIDKSVVQKMKQRSLADGITNIALEVE